MTTKDNDGLRLTTSSWRDGRAGVEATLDGELVHSDRVDPKSATSRKRFIAVLRAALPGLDDEAARDVDKELMGLVPPPPTAERAPLTAEGLVGARDAASHDALVVMDPDAITRAAEVLQSPEMLDWISSSLDAIGVVGEKLLRTTVYLVGTSRLLKKPLAAVVQGESSSGKSYVVEAVGRCFPDEQILRATDITSQALYYVGEHELVNRFVIAGERSLQDEGDLAQTRRALRELLSAGVLRKVVTDSSGDEGLETRLIERRGPIAYVETTTKTNLFNEDANRCLLLSTDESAAQTERVVTESGRRSMEANTDRDVDVLIQTHHAVQRMLFRVRVRIPFAGALAEAVPTGRTEGRRAFEQVLSMIKTVALLFQRQRRCVSGELQHGAEIEATGDDYAVARELLMGPLGRALSDDLVGAVQRFGEWWWEAIGQSREVTIDDLRKENPKVQSRSKISEYMRALRDVGVVTSKTESKPHKHQITSSPQSRGASWLPLGGALRNLGHMEPERAVEGVSVENPSINVCPGSPGAAQAHGHVTADEPKSPDVHPAARAHQKPENRTTGADIGHIGSTCPAISEAPPETGEVSEPGAHPDDAIREAKDALRDAIRAAINEPDDPDLSNRMEERASALEDLVGTFAASDIRRGFTGAIQGKAKS